jgi:hypothetical protein
MQKRIMMKIISKKSSFFGVCILTFGLVVILSFPANAGEILFKDSFVKGNTEKWKSIHGRWIGLIDKEVYRQAEGGKNKLGQSFISDLTVTDCTATLRLRFLGGLSKKGFGAGIRLRSNVSDKKKESNVYIIGLGTGEIGGVRIAKKMQLKGTSKYRTLFSDEYPPVKFGQWYKLKVRIKGAKITLWIDGEQVAEVEDKDNTIMSGAVGVYTYGAAIEIDDIVIEED